MKLGWNDYPEIAEELVKKHSELDLINITDEEVRKLVLELDSFEDSEFPSDADAIGAILTVWIQLDSEDGEYNAGQWDAYV